MAKIEKGLKGTIIDVQPVKEVGANSLQICSIIFKVIQSDSYNEREPEYWKIDIKGKEKIDRFKAIAPNMEGQKGIAECWINSNHVVKPGQDDLYIVNVVLHEFKPQENARS
jgi:hypothetical protein